MTRGGVTYPNEDEEKCDMCHLPLLECECEEPDNDGEYDDEY